MIKTHTLGLPIIGKKRELKFCIENYIKNTTLYNKLLINKTINQIIVNNITIQKKYLDIITIGYHYINDPITYTMLNLGINIIPNNNTYTNINTILTLTKGTNNTNTLKMTKWFNTNYHYFIPSITLSNLKTSLYPTLIINEISHIKTYNNIKLSIIGPITFIKKCIIKNNQKKKIFKYLINKYIYLFNIIKKFKNIQWIQLEEPILNNNNIYKYNHIIKKICKLFKNKFNYKIILTTYLNNFTNITHIIKKNHYINGIHTIYHKHLHKTLSLINKKLLLNNFIISIGIISGEHIWVSNIYKCIKILKNINYKNIWISPTCSLIHIPYSNTNETFYNKQTTSFALQKLYELYIIKTNIIQIIHKSIIKKNISINKWFKQTKNQINQFITIKNNNKHLFNKTKLLSKNKLNINNLPTTTIGSFPQTQYIRSLRNQLKNNTLSYTNYFSIIKQQIIKIIKLQELYNIDIIVSGELERNDMVEYFCEQLKGCSISTNGWVQSYSTRCVKPAIIWGKITHNNKYIIKPWTILLKNNSTHIPKEIITGPITMTKWSFIRNDIGIYKTALMFSFVLKKEINNIIKTNIKIIQVDEPALKEALPQTKHHQKIYIKQITKCFNIVCEKAYKKNIQIHTHICYSTLSKLDLIILKNIGIDAITIESSKNLLPNLKMIKNTKLYKYIEIGLGIYDVHSLYIPSPKTLFNRIKTILSYIPIKRIWINPDCGLKTRNMINVLTFFINLNKSLYYIKHSYNIK